MIAQVRPSELHQWLERHAARQAYILDVREPRELQLASVVADGFDVTTIPMSALPGRLDELDPLRPVACLCHHGARSMQVAMFLQDRGYVEVANIAGGIDAWSLELDAAVPRY
jgi:rhodanese-related sulfurtransferase